MIYLCWFKAYLEISFSNFFLLEVGTMAEHSSELLEKLIGFGVKYS